jgi:hypothetical protein
MAIMAVLTQIMDRSMRQSLRKCKPQYIFDQDVI